MRLLLVALITVAISGAAFAAGTGPGSLIAPATNVLLLLGALIYFLRKPAKEFFASKSSSIHEMLERASSKAKEAEAMMEIQRKKTSGADEEIKNLEMESQAVIKTFEAKYKTGIEQRIVLMKEDAGMKIEAEKKELLDELNSNLLDLVISKVKIQIKADAKLTSGATKNIIEGL